MSDLPPILIIVGFVLIFISASWLHKQWLLKDVAKRSVVHEGTEYQNNFRVVGAGYYHATAGKWFHLPWNEFQEGRGYFWDGDWHDLPDQRQVKASTPESQEVARVNGAWRKAETDYIEHFGFGISDRRNSGS